MMKSVPKKDKNVVIEARYLLSDSSSTILLPECAAVSTLNIILRKKRKLHARTLFYRHLIVFASAWRLKREGGGRL